jgi:hypothetical protein
VPEIYQGVRSDTEADDIPEEIGMGEVGKQFTVTVDEPPELTVKGAEPETTDVLLAGV